MDEVSRQLDHAEAYSRELLAEQYSQDGPQALQADQGHALRMVIYHGLAAIAEAIRERGRDDPAR